MHQSTDALTSVEVVERARAARATAHRVAVEELEMALVWAHLHPCRVGEQPAGWGESDLHGEGVVPIAGAGAPLVAEFAPAELAAALGLSAEQGKALVGDAVELAHRLPRLWAHVRSGGVPVWRARRIAVETRDLGPEAVAYADRLVSATPGRISQVDAARLVDEARLYYDPDRALDAEQRALASRGVWVQPGRTPATTELTMRLDTMDALAFDQAVATLAHQLLILGDADPLDTRRAAAVGILADPQQALDLMSGDGAARRPVAFGDATIYLHVGAEDLEAGGVIERLGAATTARLTDWLVRCGAAGGVVKVRPVLRMDRPDAVDSHDPPRWMRELVVLRDAHCAFPGCRRDSRRCDLDHITAFVPLADGGPPGQTRPDNLAPLCRLHHRMKTHALWSYKRLDEGAYSWTSPTGHQYDVTVPPRHAPRHP